MTQSINDYLRDAFISRGTRMTRVERKLMNEAAAMLQSLSDEIASLLAGVQWETGDTYARLNRLERLKSKVDSLIQGTYTDLQDTTDENVVSLLNSEVEWLADTMNGALGIEIFDISLNKQLIKSLAGDVMIQGAPSSAWWERQRRDLVHNFMVEMRLGIMQGESLNDMVRRVRGTRESGFTDGIMSTATRNAEALVRTSAMTVLNDARMEGYNQNTNLIRGYQSVSTLDLRTTPICRAYDGATYDMEFNPVADTKLPYLATPRHWNCRSLHIPLLYSWKELADLYGGNTKLGRKLDKMPKSTRSSMDGQVPETMTYEQWLTKKNETDPDGVREMLGEQRYNLWLSGDVSLVDMINSRGDLIPIDEL